MSEELGMNTEAMEVEAQGQGQDNGTESKTYTEEEVAALIQKESDRRVTQALKKAEQKRAQQASEAEKLSKMSEKDQETYKLQQRIAELEAKEQEFVLAENKNALSKALNERNLPVSFCDYLVDADSEKMMDNLKTFEKAWKAALNDAISYKIASSSSAPRGSMVQQHGLTKEQFNKMTLQQQTDLYNSNRELYMQMIKN